MPLTFSGNVLGYPGIMTGSATHLLEGLHVLNGIILGSGRWHHGTEQGFNFCLDVTMNGYRYRLQVSIAISISYTSSCFSSNFQLWILLPFH